MTDAELLNELEKRAEAYHDKVKKDFAIEKLEKIKAEIYRHHNITCNLKCATCFLEYNCELRRKIDLLEDLAIIDNHIKELKEESEE